MSQNYRLAQPGIVKTTTAHDSINISFKRDGTIHTKMTVKHTAVEQKYVNRSSRNKPFACDVTLIRITEYQYVCPPNGLVSNSKTQMRSIGLFFRGSNSLAIFCSMCIAQCSAPAQTLNHVFNFVKPAHHVNKTCNVCFDKHAQFRTPKETFSLV